MLDIIWWHELNVVYRGISVYDKTIQAWQGRLIVL
jgi:hypothetical protein